MTPAGKTLQQMLSSAPREKPPLPGPCPTENKVHEIDVGPQLAQHPSGGRPHSLLQSSAWPLARSRACPRCLQTAESSFQRATVQPSPPRSGQCCLHGVFSSATQPRLGAQRRRTRTRVLEQATAGAAIPAGLCELSLPCGSRPGL